MFKIGHKKVDEGRDKTNSMWQNIRIMIELPSLTINVVLCFLLSFEFFTQIHTINAFLKSQKENEEDSLRSSESLTMAHLRENFKYREKFHRIAGIILGLFILITEFLILFVDAFARYLFENIFDLVILYDSLILFGMLILWTIL